MFAFCLQKTLCLQKNPKILNGVASPTLGEFIECPCGGPPPPPFEFCAARTELRGGGGAHSWYNISFVGGSLGGPRGIVGGPRGALGGPWGSLGGLGVSAGTFGGVWECGKKAGWSQLEVSTRNMQETMGNSNFPLGLVLVFWGCLSGGLVSTGACFRR